MTLSYQIRPLSAADTEPLHDSCWPEWPLDSVREMLDRVLAMMAEKRALAVVAAAAPRVIAYGQLTHWPSTAEISDLIVAASCREQGIGTAIICYLIDVAQAWQAPQVEIGAALNNPRAVALYRRLGFRDDRTLDLDLGQGLEPVLYLSMVLARKTEPPSP